MKIVSLYFQLAFYRHRLRSIFIKLPRKCVNNPDNFCYIYGEVTFASRKLSITPTIKRHIFCISAVRQGTRTKNGHHTGAALCLSKLSAWVNGKGRFMPFGVPMVCRVPSNQSTDCYFCMVPPIQNSMPMKEKSTLVYPNIPSAIRPVPHGDGLPVPELPDNFATYSDDENS